MVTGLAYKLDLYENGGFTEYLDNSPIRTWRSTLHKDECYINWRKIKNNFTFNEKVELYHWLQQNRCNPTINGRKIDDGY